MARPRCSRNEPNRLRSMGATVRRASMKIRTCAPVDEVWADKKRPNTEFADKARPAVEACCKKRRLVDMKEISPFLCAARHFYKRHSQTENGLGANGSTSLTAALCDC